MPQHHVEHASGAVLRDDHHRLVRAGAAHVGAGVGGGEDVAGHVVQVYELVVQLVPLHEVGEAGGDRVLVVHDAHQELVEVAVAGALAPQQADHLLVLDPAGEGVVGGVQDDQPRARGNGGLEVGARGVAPLRAIVVAEDQVIARQPGGGVQHRRRIVGSGHREAAGICEQLFDERRGARPVVIVRAGQQQGVDGVHGRLLLVQAVA